jgi:hypothetical protein
MSLLRVLRERRGGVRTPARPPRLWRLIAGLAVVILMIWMASRLGTG